MIKLSCVDQFKKGLTPHNKGKKATRLVFFKILSFMVMLLIVSEDTLYLSESLFGAKNPYDDGKLLDIIQVTCNSLYFQIKISPFANIRDDIQLAISPYRSYVRYILENRAQFSLWQWSSWLGLLRGVD